MTKKDFVAVAEGLIEFIRVHNFELKTINNLINFISPKLESKNKTFDKEKFKEYILSRV